jgi:WD40 repeat protein
VSVHYNKTIIIRNAETGVTESTLQGDDDQLALSIQYSPKEDKIAAGFNKGKVMIWNSKTGEKLHTFEGNTSRVESV